MSRRISMHSELSCLFSSLVEADDKSHFIMLPSQELISLDIDTDATYRVLFLPKLPGEKSPPGESLSPSIVSSTPDALATVGDIYEVLVEDIGNKGDGIARIGPGYIIFIPKTDIGHKVKIKINSVTNRCAFAEVIEYLV